MKNHEPDVAEWPMSQTMLRRTVGCRASARIELEGTYPFVFDRGEMAYVWDVDGNRYIDYTASTGAVLLGTSRRSPSSI